MSDDILVYLPTVDHDLASVSLTIITICMLNNITLCFWYDLVCKLDILNIHSCYPNL